MASCVRARARRVRIGVQGNSGDLPVRGCNPMTLDPSLMHRLEPLRFHLGILVWDGAGEVVALAVPRSTGPDLSLKS